MDDQVVDVRLLESVMILKGFKNRGEFAGDIGASAMTISNLLNGKHQPSGKLINAIYKKLDLTPQQVVDIFFGEEERE